MKTQEVNDNQAVNENENEEEIRNKEENEQTEEKKDGTNYSLNLAILGGVVGAGISLLASPETSKKVIKNLGETEFVKIAGKEFRKTAQELLAGQAQNSIRQLATGYISKIDEGLLAPKEENGGNGGENSSSDESQSSKYEEIKEENKNLNERLQRIEKMLNDLVDSK